MQKWQEYKRGIVKEILKSFDYEKTVNEMSDEAISFCIENMFPMLGYKYMKQEDIRKVDLIERLMQIYDAIDKTDIQKYGNSPQYYCALLEQQIERSLKCKPGSDAEAYLIRARDAIKRVRDGHGTIEDIDDAFLIYTILWRTKINRDYRKGPVLAERPDHELYLSDLDILREISKKNRSGNHRQDYYLYLFNILFMTRGLERRGAFGEVDKND
jgi:hypothetical protein